jgi:hypothetical protein
VTNFECSLEFLRSNLKAAQMGLQLITQFDIESLASLLVKPTVLITIVEPKPLTLSISLKHLIYESLLQSCLIYNLRNAKLLDPYSLLFYLKLQISKSIITFYVCNLKVSN